MIVRISGDGQYELDNSGAQKLEDLDRDLTSALHAGQEKEFHQHLHSIISFIQEQGKELGMDTVVGSDVIVPPEDITMEEAQRFFTDEGLMHPLPA
jgi:effector-binding domain-containing protein